MNRHEPQLVRLGTLAERSFREAPCTCLMQLRQLAELLVPLTAAHAGLYQDDREAQLDLLRRLRDRGHVGGEVYAVFNEIRLVGNRATHAMVGDHRTALDRLERARKSGVWFHRTFGDRALQKLLASQRWTAPQRQWLECMGQQLQQETGVDKAALDQGQFKSQGAFSVSPRCLGASEKTAEPSAMVLS